MNRDQLVVALQSLGACEDSLAWVQEVTGAGGASRCVFAELWHSTPIAWYVWLAARLGVDDTQLMRAVTVPTLTILDSHNAWVMNRAGPRGHRQLRLTIECLRECSHYVRVWYDRTPDQLGARVARALDMRLAVAHELGLSENLPPHIVKQPELWERWLHQSLFAMTAASSLMYDLARTAPSFKPPIHELALQAVARGEQLAMLVKGSHGTLDPVTRYRAMVHEFLPRVVVQAALEVLHHD